MLLDHVAKLTPVTTKPLMRREGALPMGPRSATDSGLPCLSLVPYPECAAG
jgi:hypothetical protein